MTLKKTHYSPSVLNECTLHFFNIYSLYPFAELIWPHLPLSGNASRRGFQSVRGCQAAFYGPKMIQPNWRLVTSVACSFYKGTIPSVLLRFACVVNTRWMHRNGMLCSVWRFGPFMGHPRSLPSVAALLQTNPFDCPQLIFRHAFIISFSATVLKVRESKTLYIASFCGVCLHLLCTDIRQHNEKSFSTHTLKAVSEKHTYFALSTRFCDGLDNWENMC